MLIVCGTNITTTTEGLKNLETIGIPRFLGSFDFLIVPIDTIIFPLFPRK
jgi:hypothetical protein